MPPLPPRLLVLFGLLQGVALAACDESGRDAPPPSTGITFEPDRPDRTPPGAVAPYTGDDPVVLEAQARFPTGLDLHVKVITRTCSPTEGVCHNTKEYPDLHTAANFLAAIEAPCNVQPGTREGVFDRCERPGDRFELPSDGVSPGPIEIGVLEYLPGERPDYSENNPPKSTSPGLHIRLADPIATDRRELWTEGRFIRTFVDAAGYFATTLHELVHWTGHASRLDRQLSSRFRDEAYAAEELIAEMGSAFLCAHCRVDGQLQHASYIGTWLRVLRNDKRAIFVASARAQAAADYLLSRYTKLSEEEALAA